MSTLQSPVSDMLVTVKSREIQRGMLAEMRDDKTATVRHFLAAAHLEFVLADDYAQAGNYKLSIRSRFSAASCLWRAGKSQQARTLLNDLANEDPTLDKKVQEMIDELEQSS